MIIDFFEEHREIIIVVFVEIDPLATNAWKSSDGFICSRQSLLEINGSRGRPRAPTPLS
jgi:hypothetical protein